jgi:hypothetical protein
MIIQIKSRDVDGYRRHTPSHLVVTEELHNAETEQAGDG